MIFQRKYNTATVAATHIAIPLIKRAAVDFALSADWTPVAGDVTVSKDGAAAANITTLPTARTMGNTAAWEFQLSAAELSCKSLLVTVADAATKAVEDQAFIVETTGHASAMYPSDVNADNTAREARFNRAVDSNVLGTVGTGSTTTSIVTSSLDPAATDDGQFIGLLVCFSSTTTTVGLRGQKAPIAGSTTGGVLTIAAENELTTAPVSGDVFAIL